MLCSSVWRESHSSGPHSQGIQHAGPRQEDHQHSSEPELVSEKIKIEQVLKIEGERSALDQAKIAAVQYSQSRA